MPPFIIFYGGRVAAALDVAPQQQHVAGGSHWQHAMFTSLAHCDSLAFSCE